MFSVTRPMVSQLVIEPTNLSTMRFFLVTFELLVVLREDDRRLEFALFMSCIDMSHVRPASMSIDSGGIPSTECAFAE
jgi:hypothetical protein